MRKQTSNLKATGRVTLKLGGEVVYSGDNLVVTTGKSFIASRMGSTSEPVMSHMAVGTGTTPAAGTDVALETETARVALTTATVAGSTMTYTASFPAGTGTGTIAELGVFSASSGGTLLCRIKLDSPITKDSISTLQVDWDVTVN